MMKSYDIIVLGLGLQEAVISTKLSMQNLSVLNIFTESINDTFEMNSKIMHDIHQIINCTDNSIELCNISKWCLDTVCHLIMRNGKFWNFLKEYELTDDIFLEPLNRTFYYKNSDILGLPSTELEVMTSGLIGPIEKINLTKMFKWIGEIDEEDPKTYSNVFKTGNLKEEKIDALFKKFSLTSKPTQMMIYHLICNYSSKSVIENASALDVINRIKCYVESLSSGKTVPFYYPIYGFDQILMKAFGTAVVNGTEKSACKFKTVIYDPNGNVCGIELETGEKIYSKAVICSAVHVPKMVAQVSSVIQAICLLDHQINKTKKCDSYQIILPFHKYKRQHNIHVLVLSQKHRVAPENHYLVYITTIVETDNPKAELEPAMKILGKVSNVIYHQYPIIKSASTMSEKNLFILKQLQGSTALDDMMEEILQICKYFQGQIET